MLPGAGDVLPRSMVALMEEGHDGVPNAGHQLVHGVPLVRREQPVVVDRAERV